MAVLGASGAVRAGLRIGLGASVIAAAAMWSPSVGLAAPSPQGGFQRSAHVCGAVPAGSARCHADVVIDKKGAPIATVGPALGSLTPADLVSAYNLPGSPAGAGQTVAIVDAYDHPYAEADLGVYRSQFGLAACTSANGCFTKVDQNGGRNYPRTNAGWAQETSLDIDMVSAVCPACKILLVEAKSASFADLGTAVNTAAAMGANVISNSYGGSEFSSEATSDNQYFNHPGVAITVSSGDSGYGVSFPAASKYVTAVGGTTLTRTGGTGRGWTESAWSGAGSGCSSYIAKPSWQTDSGCARRSVADVSAIADPATGVAVYDSFKYQGKGGWMVFGGTSVAAPVVAGVFGLAGNASSTNPGYAYSHAGSLFDVTTGTNGSCAGYFCHAVPGYDGPTGLGTPNGTSAF